MRTFKVLSISLTLVSMFFWFSTSAIRARQPKAPTDTKAIVFGADRNFPPFQYIENGEPTGFDVDIARAVGDILDRPVEFEFNSWFESIEDLKTGQVDALVGMSRSPDRDQFFDFSIPYLTQSFSLFVHQESGIHGFNDLDGRKILIQKGGVMRDYINQKAIEVDVEKIEDAPEALKLVDEGQYEATLVPRLQGLNLIKRRDYDNVRNVIGDVHPKSYGFAVKDGDDRLLAQLNDSLAELKEGDRYETIYKKWFSPEQTPPPQYAHLMMFSLIPLFVLSIGVLYAGYWSVQLSDVWMALTILVLLPMAYHQFLEVQEWLRLGTFPDHFASEIPETAANIVGTLIIVLLGVRRENEQKARERAEEAVESEKEKSKELERALDERETLLREVHHRVKNNLQVINSMLSMEQKNRDNPEVLDSFQDSIDRIRSIAILHEQLYEGESLSQLDFEDYIDGICGHLLNTHSMDSVEFSLEIDPMDIDLDLAIPSGIIINELVSNSLEHGFASGEEGEVEVTIKNQGQQAVLTVADDGKGYPDDFSEGEPSSTGMKIVQSLVEFNLQGTMTVDVSNGSKTEIRFPLGGNGD